MRSARHLSAPIVPVILLLGILLVSPGASALTTWKETAADFPSGLNVNTRVGNGSLELDVNRSLLGNWTKVGDVSSPGPRFQHSMVYDPADGVHILIGGSWQDTDPNLNDTWTYNMSTNKWTAHPPAPISTNHEGQAMAFDTRNRVAVMFCGDLFGIQVATRTYDPALDLWTFKNPSASPAPRGLHSMVYDPGTGRIVLFGGRHYSSGNNFAYFGDTWTYDLSNNTWTNRTSGSAPSPRCGQSMAYDPTSGLLVLFGGMNDTTIFKDTWTLNPATNSWTYCSPSSSPPARSGAAMAADATGGSVILFGGQGPSGMLEDTWSYNVTGNIWTSKALGNQPSPRWGTAMTYDQLSGKLFFFGGQLGEPKNWDVMDDYGSYDPALNNWTKLGELTAPRPRLSPGIAFDSTRGLGVLFGGSTDQFNFGDTWTYGTSNNGWSRMHPKSSPGGRTEASMCYDTDDGLVVLFGGIGMPEWLVDTWTYNIQNNTWTNRQPTAHPPAGSGCMAYDPESHLVIYFGGGWPYDNQTWDYNLTANLWTLRTPPVSPPARSSAAMVYDESSHLIIMFGGLNGNSALGDTWAYNTSTSNWTPKSSIPSQAARYYHAMAFDSEMGSSLLFGGRSSNGQIPFGDTWAYNSSTDNWTELSPTSAPTPRIGASMFYDSKVNAMVLFGGADTDHSGFKGDTWLLGLSGRYSSGTYTCAPKDTGGKAYFGSLSWQSTTPANTSVKLQFRSGSSPADMEAKSFLGPDGTSGTYYTMSGQRIPSIHNDSRWIQYRAYLASGNLLGTPTVPSVTVDLNLIHDIAITSPAAGEDWTGQHRVNWTSDDPDGDQLLVDVYLLNETGGRERLAISIPAGEGSWLWDTSYAPNGTYRISLVSRDENPAIPLSVETTSGPFIVHNNGTGPSPGTNHPPTVMMRSPVDGASLVLKPPAAVTLEWNGSDIDGNTLNYTVYISNSSFNLSALPPPAAQTGLGIFNASGLLDNTTYFWTVTASDGIDTANGTVWKFSVKFGLSNIPPRITSIPPASATVGAELVYQVTAVDDDGGNITFSLTSVVVGMAIDPLSGRINWTPRPGQAGDVAVAIRASDGQGGYAEQKFLIFVAEPPVMKPVCKLVSPSKNAIVRGRFLANGTAVNGSFGIVRVQVRIDQRDWIDAGRASGNWSLELDTRHVPNGPHIIEARAFDGRNYSDIDAVGVHVRNPERDFDTSWSPAGIIGFFVFLAASIFLCWHLILRKGGPPAMT